MIVMLGEPMHGFGRYLGTYLVIVLTFIGVRIRHNCTICRNKNHRNRVVFFFLILSISDHFKHVKIMKINNINHVNIH